MGDLRSIVDRFYEAYNSGHFEPGLELLDEDVETTISGAGTLRGREPFRAYAQAFKDAAPDSRIHVNSVIQSGEAIVVEGMFTGTHTAPLRGPRGEIPATNRSFQLPFAEFFHVRDGKVVRRSVYFDQMELLGQLGVAPGPGGVE